MLRLAAVAFVLAIIAGFLGQGTMANLATQAAIVLVLVALVLLVIGMVAGRGSPPAV